MDEKSVTGNLNMLDFRASPLSDIAVIRPSELNGLIGIGKHCTTFGDLIGGPLLRHSLSTRLHVNGGSGL